MKGFTCIKHSIWKCDLTKDERYMLMFLLDCENRFEKNGEWFNLNDDDFVQIGFGKDKVVIRKVRNSLVNKKLIQFKKGAVGKKSQYRINRKNNENNETKKEANGE